MSAFVRRGPSAEAALLLYPLPAAGGSAAELGLAYVEMGMPEKAIAELHALDQEPSHPRVKGMLGYAYAEAKKRPQAQKVLEELKRLAQRYGVAPV
jgi:predicted Zn-dependent protease